MSRLIDADAVVKYLHEFRCADCDRRKGLKNGKIQFCYETGDVPCRACDIGDTIEYFLDEDIALTIDAVPVEWLREWQDEVGPLNEWWPIIDRIITVWHEEQEAQDG